MHYRTAELSSSRLRVFAAFAAVYIIWGSTYLGIRVAVETIPPFVMACGRYLIGGAVLYALARRSSPAPTRQNWRAAIIIGAFMILGNAGLLTWSEQFVPSGMAALLLSTTPFWMILLDWLIGSRIRPTAGTAIGLVLGLVGIALLTLPNGSSANSSVDLLAAAALLFAALSWAIGAIYSRHAQTPASPLLGTALQMLTGGVWLLLASIASGELGSFKPASVSSLSLVAMVYLIIFGQFIGFTSYMWLLRVTTPARVSTTSFVNPVIAVFLGWALAGEPLTAQTLIAASIILAGVLLITLNQPALRARGK